MSIDLSYYDGKFPYCDDVELDINGQKNRVGKHSYGIELISRHHYDPKASFHIGRFCAIANTEFYLGGSKDLSIVSTAFFMPKYFLNSTYGEDSNPVRDNKKNNIYIGHDVWIGNNSTIMHGVKIGHGAVIAANSHVVSDVPAYAIFGGNPAKFIKYRFTTEIIALLQALRWWELEDSVINEILPALGKEPNVLLVEDLIKFLESSPRSSNLLDVDFNYVGL